MNIVGLESGTVGLDEETANLVVFIFHLGPDHGHVGYRAGSNPHFFAVQDVFFANFAGARPHASGIGTEIRFGESEATQLFAFLHGGQPGVFLLVRAESVDRIHHQRRLHADKRPHARVAALQFLRDQAIFDVRHAGAAVTRKRGAEEAEIGHGLDQFAREAAGAIALFDDRDEVVFNELARRVAHQALVVIQQRVESDEVHTAKFDGWHKVSPQNAARRQWQTIQSSRGAGRRAIGEPLASDLWNPPGHAGAIPFVFLAELFTQRGLLIEENE